LSNLITDEETGKPKLVLTRIFEAPRTLVWKAWTNPEHLAKWWGPKYYTNPVCKLDLRAGGAILLHMKDPAGVVYPMAGVFHEVKPPERLVFTNRAFESTDGQYLLEVHNTITFSELGSTRTKLTLEALVIKADPSVDAAFAGMEEGWSQSFEKLSNLLVDA
jgi:uncharacterized protein YndB with AHSA1/START domain